MGMFREITVEWGKPGDPPPQPTIAHGTKLLIRGVISWDARQRALGELEIVEAQKLRLQCRIVELQQFLAAQSNNRKSRAWAAKSAKLKKLKMKLDEKKLKGRLLVQLVNSKSRKPPKLSAGGNSTRILSSRKLSKPKGYARIDKETKYPATTREHKQRQHPPRSSPRRSQTAPSTQTLTSTYPYTTYPRLTKRRQTSA